VSAEIDLAKFKDKAKLTDRYARQLQRLKAKGIAPACIEEAVEGTMVNLGAAKTASLVVYGEPQSGKTEMMICLTARLMDDGHPIIVHLMNDSVDLLSQTSNDSRPQDWPPQQRAFPRYFSPQLPKTQGG